MKDVTTNANRVCALIVALASLLIMCVPGGASAARPSAIVVVSDQPARFLPARIVIKAGQTVEWKNTGKLLHSVTDDPAKVEKPQAISLPRGAARFDSGFMMPGAVYEHTFTVPGTYRYVCLPHQADGMAGEVVVRR